MIYVPLTRGFQAVIDDDDLPLVEGISWQAMKGQRSRTVYAKGFTKGSQHTRKLVSMHRLIVGAQPGQLVDHIDMDGLNNQRSNLRIVDYVKNARHRSMLRNNSSGFRGVTFVRGRERWVSRIGVGGTHVFLGYFKTKEEAALAYNEAALRLYGPDAQLNEVD